MSIEINKENLTPRVETGVPVVETAPIPVQQDTVLETNNNPIPTNSPVTESNNTRVEENRGGIKVSKEVGNDPHSGDAWAGTIENKILGEEIRVL